MSDFEDVGIEVKLIKSFPLVKETLERMGYRVEDTKTFYPSCYCICKDNNYRIVHFKEMFSLEGKPTTYSKLDQVRRDTIVYFLVKWGLVDWNEEVDSILQEKIDILKASEKRDYKIKHKYMSTVLLDGHLI